jgi:hypothetical protein
MLIIADNLMIELLFILSLIFMDDIVQNFRWHVFGCGHGELRNVFEFEAGTVIDEFDLSEIEGVRLTVMQLVFYEYILCFEVRMDNLTVR